jgi:hypothetical protein
MKKIKHIIVAFVLVSATYLKGQFFVISFGPSFTKTNALTPVANGKEDFSNTDYFFLFSYEHLIAPRYSLSASYSEYDGCTFINFEEGGWIAGGGVSLAKGFCGGTKLHRFDAVLSYLLTNDKQKFYFKPFAGAGLQLSRTTGWEFGISGLPINGPDYFELEPMSATNKNTSQIVPSLGFRTGFLFWKRLDVGLGVQGVYAFKAYQKMYLKYQYKGIVQPMAEYESTGTGLFVTLGIGYRFARLIKSNK